jgi:hypothetical protein
VKAECGSIWGILEVLGGLQIGSTVFLLGVTVGLNNQQLDTVLLF